MHKFSLDFLFLPVYIIVNAHITVKIYDVKAVKNKSNPQSDPCRYVHISLLWKGIMTR